MRIFVSRTHESPTTGGLQRATITPRSGDSECCALCLASWACERTEAWRCDWHMAATLSYNFR